MKHQPPRSQPQANPSKTSGQPKALGQRAEAVAVICLLACLGALGLHAATQTTSFDPVAATVGNARLLALAVTQYSQDYDERLPSTQSVAAFQTALRPYVPDPAVFNSRVTGQPFVPNAAVSGKTITEFSDFSTVALFRDAVPPSTTPATVGFLDGHVERGGVFAGNVRDFSYQNAKALALGVVQYTQDSDGIYPPMQTQAAFQTALFPYVRSSRVFVDPSNSKPFVPNAALSQMSAFSVADPAHTVLLQTDTPYSNGASTIAYADGHVSPVPPDLAPSPGIQDASNLKQIGLATVQFTQDNNEVLPTTTDYSAFEADLMPYLKTNSVFMSPGSGLPYTLNPAISGASFGSISDPANTEEARDARINPDGVFNYLELDGHVKQNLYFLPKSLLVTPGDRTHLLWRSAAPLTSLWTLLPGGSIVKTTFAAGGSTLAFSAGGDGQIHLLVSSSEGPGAASLATAGAEGALENSVQYGPYDGWQPVLLATGPDSMSRLLWHNTSGSLALWTLSAFNSFEGSIVVPRLAGGTLIGMAVGRDNLVRLLWKTASGGVSLWTISANGKVARQIGFVSPTNRVPTALGIGADGASRLLWSDSKDNATVRTVTSYGRFGLPLSVTLPGGGTAVQISAGKTGDLRLLWIAANGSGQLQTLTAQGTQTSVQSLTPYL